MNGKKAREIRKAVQALDAEYIVTPMPALKTLYKDIKTAYTRGQINENIRSKSATDEG